MDHAPTTLTIRDLRPLSDEHEPIIDLASMTDFSRTIIAVAHQKDRIWRDVGPRTKNRIDLSHPQQIHCIPLKSIRALDISTVSIRRKITRRIRWEKLKQWQLPICNEPRILEIISLSDTPMVESAGALDIRSGKKILSATKYSDLQYRRNLKYIRTRNILQRYHRQYARPIHIVATISMTTLVLFAAVSASAVVLTYSQYNSLRDTENSLESTRTEKIAGKFSLAQNLFAPLDFFANNRFFHREEISTLSHLISGGKHLSTGLAGLMSLRELLPHTLSFSSGETLISTDQLKISRATLEAVEQNLSFALDAYDQISSLGSDERNTEFFHVRELLRSVTTGIQEVLTHFDAIVTFLGGEVPQNILVLNQNRDEIRATGGFPGSVISLRLYKGTIEAFEKKDIYFYDWHLYPNKISPPEGIDQLTDTFGMRDANYYPEMSKNFEMINFFYEKSGGNSLDSIIFIHQGILEKLLTLTGDIEMPEVGMKIGADNFSLMMSLLVEAKVERKTSAKDILFVFVDRFLERIQNIPRDALLGILSQEWKSGEIRVASRVTGINELAEATQQTESWKGSGGNWIYPLFTNIGGNKSDRYMRRLLTMSTSSESACVAMNTLLLTSTHEYSKNEELTTRKLLIDIGKTDPTEVESLMYIQGNGPNKQFVRFLAPENANLNAEKSPGIKSQSMSGYTMFSGYISTPVRSETQTTLVYSVPLKNCIMTGILYRQPGLKSFEFITK